MSATDDSGEVKVGPPGVKMGVMIKFAVASMAMVATPTSIFFLSHYGYLDWFWALTVGVPEESQRAAVSGIAAVAAVNVVVAIFVMMAFNEKDVAKDKKAGRKDE